MQIPFDRKYGKDQKRLCGNIAPCWMPDPVRLAKKEAQSKRRFARALKVSQSTPPVDTSKVKIMWHEQPVNKIKERATKVVKNVKQFFGRLFGR